MPRKSAYSRLLDHFHTHPQGRLHEMLFWMGLGLLLGGLTLVAWLRGWLNAPLALIAAVVALCFFLWAFLPQKKAPAPRTHAGRLRAEVAKQVAASKAERKRARRK